MELFTCHNCGARAFFGSMSCENCGATLIFRSDIRNYGAATPCANRDDIGCNWAAEEGDLCRACAMTQVIPDTFHGENRELWALAERSKRWVLAGLARWGWFTPEDPGPAPTFHLLAEATRAGPATVIMGHADGLVTINVTEADPVERVSRREALGERMRTMTAHFRHEVAHFLFLRLAERPEFPPAFRALMGDEREDYAAALERHYAEGPPADAAHTHITAYATAHPHEDWAETAAHVMHLTDMLDSAVASGIAGRALPRAGYDAYAERDPARLVGKAVRLGIALNHVNRSMGLPDIYPFVLRFAVRRKIAAVHRWLAAGP